MTNPGQSGRNADRPGITAAVPKRSASGRGASGTEPRHMGQVQIVADLLDRAIRIPGTNMRIGLDPLLGIIPGAGDVVGAGLSGYVILLAAKAGAPNSLIARMVANVAMDSVFGAIPAIGDLFDFAWKSNTKNVDLLRQHMDRPAETRAASRGFVALMLLLLALLAIGAIWAAITVGKLLWGLIGG